MVLGGGAGHAARPVPASVLRNERVPLDALWGRRAHELHARLHKAATAQERFLLMEAELLARLDPAPPTHPAVGFALRALSQVPRRGSVGDLADEIGLSARPFIHVFTEQVDLTPKRFERLQRFQEVLRCAHQECDFDWTRTALRCGFYDQAHLIRDFVAFSGLRPGDYRRLRGEDPHHVAIGD